jgi:diacylglycerol O-acyltransferase
MTSGQSGDRLCWGDALFLYLERAGMPLNIASVSIFEGEISLADCIRSIASKLPLLPRYRQRIVAPPLNVGFPCWEPDPYFDIRNHIHEVTLKLGSERELRAVAGRVLGTVMDRRRPLWDLTLVRGFERNRTALVMRAHHCLADGIAGVGLMSVLMDSGTEPPSPAKKGRSRQPRRPQGSWTLLLEGCVSTSSDFIQRVLTAQAELVKFSENLLAAGDWPAGEFTRFLPELTAPTERLFFNMTYQGPQKFAWARIPLPTIRAIREKSGATHNDVVLALMTATVERYAELHGENVRGRRLRMMVPVSVRRGDQQGELGNCISLVPVTVPLGIRRPGKLLAAVHERVDFLKRAHIAELVGIAGGLLGAAPPPLQALIGPIASLLPITPFNLVCSNVRGPESPLYLLGHKMLDWYPYVPVGGEMALNCAILSYNDVTYFGFSGDAYAAPGLERLPALLILSLTGLLRAFGIKPEQRKRSSKVRPEARQDRSASASAPAATVTLLNRPVMAQRPAAKGGEGLASFAAD